MLWGGGGGWVMGFPKFIFTVHYRIESRTSERLVGCRVKSTRCKGVAALPNYILHHYRADSDDMKKKNGKKTDQTTNHYFFSERQLCRICKSILFPRSDESL